MVRLVVMPAEPPDWADRGPEEGAASATRQEQQPLWSREAEQSLIGSLLEDGRALDLVSDLIASTDFFDVAHQEIYSAVRRIVAAGGTVDVVTVYEALQSAGALERVPGNLVYINQLAQCVPSSSNARRYAEIVRGRALLRKLMTASDQMRESCLKPEGRTPDEIVTEAEEKVAELMRERTRKLPSARIPLLTVEQLRKGSQAVRWLVKRLIPADAVGMIFGGSGTFKSFVALDCALHVAHGMTWCGRKTTQGPVIYLAAEGGTGLWPRIDAWHRSRRKRVEDVPIHVVTQAVDLTVDAWRVVEAAQSAGVTPALIVIDTLSQTFGGEENSAQEVAAYLRELGARFRALWGCAVLVVHHSGHSATERPRGSSAIRANVDFLLGVHRDEKEMIATLSCAKLKDGESFEDLTFSLRQHDLGTDDDGDRLTSLVAWHLSSSEEIVEAMAAESKAGRGGKNQLLANLAQPGMKERDLRSAFYEESGLTDAEARKKAYQRAKAWCSQNGIFEVAEGIVITLRGRKGDK